MVKDSLREGVSLKKYSLILYFLPFRDKLAMNIYVVRDFDFDEQLMVVSECEKNFVSTLLLS